MTLISAVGLDDGAGILGVEGVLHPDGDILDADGVNGRRIDDFRTEIAELHSLHVAQLVDRVRRLDHARIGGHETVDIGPDLQYLGIKGGGDDSGGIVTATTSEIRDLVGFPVAGDKTGHEAHARQIGEGLLDEFVGQLSIEDIAVVTALRLDKVAGVEPLGTADQRGHDITREALSVGDDGVLRLLTEIVDEVDTIINTLQLVEEGVDGVKQILALGGIGDDRVNHLMVTVDHLVEFRAPCFLMVEGKLGSGEQFVGDASEGTDNDDDRLVLGLVLYNFL